MNIHSLYDHYLTFRVKDSVSGDTVKVKIYYIEQSSGTAYWWDWTNQQWTTSPSAKEGTMTFVESEIWMTPYVQMSSGWAYNNVYNVVIINYSDNQIFHYNFRVNYYWLDDLLPATDSRLNNLDATVSSRADGAYYTSTRAAKLDNLDATVSSRANATYYTQARATKLDNLDATITSRAPASTALSNTVWTDAKAGYLDTNISSRLASNDNRLDNLDAAISSRANATYYTQARAEKLDNLDATITSRPTLSQIEASTVLAKENTVSAVKSQTDKLQFTVQNDVKATLDGETVVLDASQPNYAPSKAGDQMALTTTAENNVSSKVWQNTTRKLTSAWTDETEPRDMAGIGTFIFPPIETKLSFGYIKEGDVFRIIRGDSVIIPFNLAKDMTGYSIVFIAKNKEHQIGPKEGQWNNINSGTGYISLSGLDTINKGSYLADIEFWKDQAKITIIRFKIEIIHQVRDI